MILQVRDDSQTIRQQTEHPFFYPQDEISLSEVIAVLRRRYLLIVCIVVLAMIIAVAYIAITPSVYESRTVLRLGLVGGMQDISDGKPIEASTILVRRLQEDYGIEDDKERPGFPRLDSVSADKSSAELIEITARAYSPGDAQNFLSGVTDTLLFEHQQLYDRARQVWGGQLGYLRSVEATINKALVDINIQMKQLTQRDTSTAALFSLEKTRLVEQSLEVQGRISQIEVTQEMKSYPSSLLRTATYSENIVSPKRLLILMLAFILALIVGIVLAFMVEFASSNSRNDEGKDAKAKD
ncbi:MAG: hypothetical protein JKY90_07040 [Gammaproteobacteria bacterium]|nr:hypothetical protein [Gammaproteobacteria bacterium]